MSPVATTGWGIPDSCSANDLRAIRLEGIELCRRGFGEPAIQRFRAGVTDRTQGPHIRGMERVVFRLQMTTVAVVSVLIGHVLGAEPD